MKTKFTGWFPEILKCERCRNNFGKDELIFNVCEPCYVLTYGEIDVDYVEFEGGNYEGLE